MKQPNGAGKQTTSGSNLRYSPIIESINGHGFTVRFDAITRVQPKEELPKFFKARSLNGNKDQVLRAGSIGVVRYNSQPASFVRLSIGGRPAL